MFGLAFVLYLTGVILAFVRWYWLVRAAGLTMTLRDAIRLGFIGLPFNLVIPGAVGGDVIKAAYFCREQRAKTRPIASIVIDRLVGLLGLFVLAILVGTLGWSRLDPMVRQLVLVAGLIALITASILGSAFLPLHQLPIRRAERLRNELSVLGASYRGNVPSVLGCLALSVVTHGFNVLAFYATSRALYARVPNLADHFLIVPLVLFSTAIPLPFGALGASEKISQELFELVSYQGGAVAMIAFRVLQLIGAAIGMVVYLANKSLVRQMRQSAQELEETEAAGDALAGEVAN
jgi:uncharacterized membrane protein YbhN (UPF0104 family)